MSFVILCRGCQRKLRLADTLVDKVIKCPHCASKFIFRKPKPTAKAAPAPAVQAVPKGKKGATAAARKPASTRAESSEGVTANPKQDTKATKSNSTKLAPTANHKTKIQPAAAKKPATEPPAPAATKKDVETGISSSEPQKPPRSAPPSLGREPAASGAQASSVALSLRKRGAGENDAALPPFGVISLLLGVMAWILAEILGIRSLTIAMAGIGIALVLVNVVLRVVTRRTRGVVWDGVGATGCTIILSLALFAPAWLNAFWAMDTVVPVNDANKFELIARDQPKGAGRPMAEDEYCDVMMDAVRQDEIVIRVEYLRNLPLPDKGPELYALIHLQFTHIGSANKVPISWSDKDKKPALMDESGRSYAFIEQRSRKEMKVGEVIFEPTIQQNELLPKSRLDQLLVFEAPAKMEGLKLHLPASAWGRQGVCKLRIEKVFEASQLPPRQ